MDRWVDFAGLFNFRDVAMLTGRPGVLYRSDALCSLVEQDRPRYESLGVHTVIDLRRPEEIEGQGRAPQWACQVWHNVTLHEEVWPVGECETEDAVSAYLAGVYLGMHAADVVKVLRILAQEATGPAVLHCAGGRDRTGVVVALLLSLVGVGDAEIAADYAETEKFTLRWLQWHHETTGETVQLPPNIRYTPPEAILGYLGQLRELHGSVQDYLMKAGLDTAVIEALRARMAPAAL
ncbi:phosphotyrosine protein phosphatase [Rhizocola hellebori]|uniref:Phosphotyrosine protein phosphatase n=1 Tax=Rhizocola hellebori TaxID=1392758 RepID=A0A8J3VF26_9ACTN|nr:tyrosine-protein phosphatase [Rhizocola hellebori]GIH05004.1 phosphotyrosine protein phosphatase [Rhizocola hellebori]